VSGGPPFGGSAGADMVALPLAALGVHARNVGVGAAAQQHGDVTAA